jgi:hypothetical protein
MQHTVRQGPTLAPEGYNAEWHREHKMHQSIKKWLRY